MSVLNKLTNTPGPIEWYTPSWVLESARKTMGSIDLDPASTAAANETVKATKFYDIEQDGLMQYWEGNVWLNPPYARNQIRLWIEKLVESPDINQWICITNNATETKWGQHLLSESGIVLFPYRRIAFYNHQYGEINHATQGQMIVGSKSIHHSSFIENFKPYGTFFATIGAIAYTARD